MQQATIDSLIDSYFNKKQEMKRINDEKSALQAEIDKAEYELIQAMQDNAIHTVGNAHCTCSVKAAMYPNIKDMAGFAKWCVDNGRTEMIQKRVSSAVFREYVEEANMLPDGVETYERLTINMRSK